jgi:hypothetical protein
MSRRCTICLHAAREEIDMALVSARGTFRRLAATYGVSASALRRHGTDHVAEVLRKATSLDAIAQADTLHGQLQGLRAHTLSVYARAKDSGDLKAELAAIRELRSIAELEDRARDKRGDIVQLHVLELWVRSLIAVVREFVAGDQVELIMRRIEALGLPAIDPNIRRLKRS